MELSANKIAIFAQLSESIASQIVIFISKGIGYQLKEGKQVVVDLGLNDFLVFDQQTVTFQDKKQVRDSLVLNSGHLCAKSDTSSVFDR